MTSDSAKLLQHWFQFMATAMNEQKSSPEMWQSMSQLPMQTQAFQEWVNQYWPNTSTDTAKQAADSLEQWTSDWQKAMGVVPRARYLELLEENDKLVQKLKRAEAKIEQLTKTSQEAPAASEAVAQTSALWQNFFQEVGEAQANIAKQWQESQTSEGKSDSESDTKK